MDNNQNNQNNYYNDPYNSNANAGTNYYYTPNQAYQTAEPPKRRNVATLVLSIVSLVCGITALELSWCYGIGLIFGIAGLITRNIALKKNNGVGGNMAKAGFITSLIGVIISALIILFFIILIAAGIASADSFNSDFNVDYYY